MREGFRGIGPAAFGCGEVVEGFLYLRSRGGVEMEMKLYKPPRSPVNVELYEGERKTGYFK